MNHDQQADPQHATPRQELSAEHYRAAQERATEAPLDRALLDFASRATD